jgi:hypothetical protein
VFICINNTISMAFNPRVSVLRRNPFWWKSWYLSENGSDWMLNYWSLHYFPTCCDDIIFLCLICFVQEFFWFCVFFFFLCLVYFFALVLFLGCFHVKPRFLGCLWSNQKFQVNLVGSTRSSLPSQKHLGQRVYTLFGLPFCFAKGSFGLRVCLKNIP